MATSPERRSPSLESVSSASSAFSFDDNPGVTPISPLIAVQSASQGGFSNFWTQAEQEDWLFESERVKRKASLGDEHATSFEASQAPVEAYPMHERFCFPAENIYFLVEGVLYSVHRYFFERDSSSFVGQGLSKQEPMALANVSTHDFDLFLSILYPTSFGAYPASTVEEWAGILHLADKWSFQSIRALSIAQIAPIASPIDKIVFGRLYNINEWLTGAYHAVCTRPDALILEEGRRLGVDDVIRINAIRQDFCFVRVSQSASNLFEEDVESRFGLAIQMEHSTPAAVAKAKPTEVQYPEPPTMGQQRSGSPTVGKSSKNSKKAGPLVLGDTTDVEPSALTPVDENSNETTLARALKGAGGTQGKVLREKEQSRIPSTSIGTAAENEVWSHLTAIQRWSEKKATIENERDAEERAELVKQMKQQLADEANTAAGGAAQEGAGGTSAASDGTNSVSIPEPNGTTGVSDTSTGAAASEKAFWSLLTPQERYREKMYKIGKEYQAEEHAERAAQLLKEAKQMMADEAKAAEEEEEVRRWSS